MTAWYKRDPESGVTQTAVAEETTPGVYLVSAEVMHDLMQRAGWTEVQEP